MNNFNFTGNIGRDAEFRAFPNGGGVATFTCAVRSGFGDRQTTIWFRCNIFGKRAEGGLIPYLVKGQQIAGNGELSENKWTDKDGVERTTLEISIHDIDLVGSKSAPQQAPSHAGDPQPVSAGAQVDLDSDIPFS